MTPLTPKHILLLQTAYGGALDWLDAAGKRRSYVLDLQHWGLIDANMQITQDGLFVLEQTDNKIAITF